MSKKRIALLWATSIISPAMTIMAGDNGFDTADTRTAITASDRDTPAHDHENAPGEGIDFSAIGAQNPFDFDFLYNESSAKSAADSIAEARSRFTDLTEQDYREVAEELGVETAAIKAVVDIEAGLAHNGFWAPGKPLINFDLPMYRKYAKRRGISLKKARKKYPVIFAKPDRKRYGSYQSAQQARLDAACRIDTVSAYEGTFWGMFQIGGFNWNKCGTKSIQEFVELMSRSERDQLELFARFIMNDGKMVEAIRQKKWLKFALRYNGPRAKSRGYHKRLAESYRKHKKLEKSQTENN